MSYAIGLISGTSMDGIDAALMEVESHQLIDGFTFNFTSQTHQILSRLQNNPVCNLSELAKLHKTVGLEFCDAARTLIDKSGLNAQQIQVIGSHGQTLCHDALHTPPYTLQIGCAQTLATELGIPVVADFRTRDLALGGMGAPLAPLFHQKLFSHIDAPLAVINLGGIANMTLLHKQEILAGYDTGPANCLMDLWTQNQLGKPYDDNGDWAQQGRVNVGLLDSLLKDPYLSLPPPKSIGKEYFSLEWLQKKIQEPVAAEDVQATLLAFTCRTLADAVLMQNLPARTVVLCGGGAHNSALIQTLQSYLPGHEVASIEAYGHHPDYIEAMLFAWLATHRVTQTTFDLSELTGTTKPALIGTIYEP